MGISQIHVASATDHSLTILVNKGRSIHYIKRGRIEDSKRIGSRKKKLVAGAAI